MSNQLAKCPNNGKIYQKRSMDVDVNIVEPADVHDRVDVVRCGFEDDSSILAAFSECP